MYLFNIVLLLLGNLLSTYVLYMYMHAFFEELIFKRSTVMVLYGLQYTLSSLIIIFNTNVWVNILNGIISYTVIVFCHKGTLRKKLSVIGILYLLGIVTEQLIAVLHKETYLDSSGQLSFNIFDILAVNLIQWLLVTIFKRYLPNAKHFDDIPLRFLIAIIVEMLLCINLDYQMFQKEATLEKIKYLVALETLTMCLVLLYLFHSLTNILQEKAKLIRAENQCMYYHEQAKLLEENARQLSAFRHDSQNKYIALHEFLNAKEYQLAEQYLENLMDKLTLQTVYCNTGNITIDSIVNYKLNKASQAGVMIQTEISIPSEIFVSTDDLIVLLGNLLDNAIEATLNLSREGWITLKLKQINSGLAIKIFNNYTGPVFVNHNAITTSKKDNSHLHGLGLDNAKMIADKYHAHLKIDYTQNVFSVFTNLYPLN